MFQWTYCRLIQRNQVITKRRIEEVMLEFSTDIDAMDVQINVLRGPDSQLTMILIFQAEDMNLMRQEAGSKRTGV